MWGIGGRGGGGGVDPLVRACMRWRPTETTGWPKVIKEKEVQAANTVEYR